MRVKTHTEFKLDKGSSGFRAVQKMADERNVSISEVVMLDDLIDPIVEAIYADLPRLMRFTISKPKFRVLFLERRGQLANFLAVDMESK